MSDEKFDAIIVGGGLAGCSAAIVLARAGLEVLLVERGDYCGAKNMTGGRLYGHSLEKLIPGFAEEAPIERVVKREKVSLLTPDGGRDIGYSSGKLSAGPECASYTVLRAKFDQWMAEKAEEAGAEVAAGGSGASGGSGACSSANSGSAGTGQYSSTDRIAPDASWLTASSCCSGASRDSFKASTVPIFIFLSRITCFASGAIFFAI